MEANIIKGENKKEGLITELSWRQIKAIIEALM